MKQQPQWTPWLSDLLFSLEGPRPKVLKRTKVLVEGRKVPYTVYEPIEAARERAARRKGTFRRAAK